MKKHLVAVVLICILVLLTGLSCKKEVQEGDYHKGYLGLVPNFLKNAPPREMYENTDFKIALELKNKGTCDIRENRDICGGYVQIEGFDPDIIAPQGLESGCVDYDGVFVCPIPNIFGKSVDNPGGSYDVVAFPGSAYYFDASLRPEVDSYEPTILGTACYTYLTEATPIVCVDPDPYGINIKNKACYLRDVVLSGGQGAPIAITKVEPNVLKDKESGLQYLQFRIFVEHAGTKGSKKTSKEGVGAVGKGIVVDSDTVFLEGYHSTFGTVYRRGDIGCAPPDYNTVNRVKISGRLSGTNFGMNHHGSLANCQPDTYEITLDENGKGSITCKVQIPSGGEAYTAPLYIKLYYGYIATVSIKTNIVQLPGTS